MQVPFRQFQFMQLQSSMLNSAIGLTTAAVLFLVSGLPATAGSSSGRGTTPEPSSQPVRTPVAQTGTIVDIAASNPSFTTLVQAIQAAGLAETLSGNGPFTVFAPTNAAFAALPPGTLETLLKPENRDTLRRILTYHVVAGAVASGDIQPGSVTTVEGSPVQVTVTNGMVMVNNATVRTADIRASNGIIHVIDRVLLPPRP